MIVDSLDAIPAAERARAERISYESSPRAPIQALDGARVGVDWPSFAAGFGCALLLGLVLLVFRRTSSPFARLIAFALAAAVIGGSYLGWLRRSTGQSEALLATPSAVIDDARRAVERLQTRNTEQEQQLERILREK